MPSEEMQRIIDMVPATAPFNSGDLKVRRESLDFVGIAVTEIEGSTYQDVVANSVEAQWVNVPDGEDHSKVLLYLHGGGYSVGSIISHRRLAGKIAHSAKLDRALIPNYRLAPENPYPGAVEDALSVYKWLVNDQKIAPDQIVVAGDSAGGGLSAALLLSIKQNGLAMPGGAVFLSPWLDLTGSGESCKTRRDRDPMLTPEMLDDFATTYSQGQVALTEPLVSPLFGDFAGFPKCLIQVGDAEILLSDSTRFHEKLLEAGVDVAIEIFDEMIHVFQIFGGMAPEPSEAISKIGTWIRQL